MISESVILTVVIFFLTVTISHSSIPNFFECFIAFSKADNYSSLGFLYLNLLILINSLYDPN